MTISANTIPGQILTSAYVNNNINSGLVYINEISYSNATNPQILGCFSSTYQNYQIVISHYGSATTTFGFQMISGTSTVDNNANYFGYGLQYSGGTTDIGANAATSQRCGGHQTTSTIQCQTTIDLSNPNVASRTQATIHAFDSGAPALQLISAQVASTTQYTGIQLVAASGNITGKMIVYGYRQA